MNKLKGKRTYIVAALAFLYQLLYTAGKIPVDPETNTLILTGFGSAAVATGRAAIAAATPKEE